MKDQATAQMAAELAADMPDIIKLTAVGLTVEAPTVGPDTEPNMVEALDFFVEIGLAVSTIEGERKTYHPTALCRAVVAIVGGQSPSGDGTMDENFCDCAACRSDLAKIVPCLKRSPPNAGN